MGENNQRMLNLLNQVSLICKKYHSDDKTDQESDVDSDKDYSDEEIDESKYGDLDKGEELYGIRYDEPGEIIKDEESDTKNEDKGKDKEKLQEESPIEESPEEKMEVNNDENDDIRHTRKIEVLPMSIEVFPSLDTFKVHGYIKKSKLLMMIHAGATLNFMDRNQVKRLGLQVKRKQFSIMTIGHKKLMCEGIIKNVQVQMGNYICNESFFVAPMGGVDAILGIQWLKTLGTYETNHAKDFMEFKQKGIKYKIYGIKATKGRLTKYQQRKADSTTPTLFSMIVKQKVKDIDAREARTSKEELTTSGNTMKGEINMYAREIQKEAKIEDRNDIEGNQLTQVQEIDIKQEGKSRTKDRHAI